MPACRVMTFDCYGTLIDWEQGMRGALKCLIRSRGLAVTVDAIHQRYGEVERQVQAGPYRSYREVLRMGVKGAFQALGVQLSGADADIFADTLPTWPLFPDTTEVLRQLKRKGHRLVILSNVDDDLVEGTVRAIGVEFDGVITAEQVRSYKPAPGHWDRMLEAFQVPKEQVFHVAQSYYHDLVPAARLGFTTVWINRYGPPLPDSVQPDYQFRDLRGLLTIL